MKEKKRLQGSERNLVMRRHNMRVKIVTMDNFALKEMSSCYRYNNATKQLKKEISEWLLYHPNVKTSCISSDEVKVLNPESKQGEVLSKMWIYFSVRNLQNDTIKLYDNGGFVECS